METLGDIGGAAIKLHSPQNVETKTQKLVPNLAMPWRNQFQSVVNNGAMIMINPSQI